MTVLTDRFARAVDYARMRSCPVAQELDAVEGRRHGLAGEVACTPLMQVLPVHA